MAVTTQKSTEEAKYDNFPRGRNDVLDDGKVRVAHFTFTQSGAGDATSTVELCRLKAGQMRILTHLSIIAFDAFGASRVLDIGYRAYTKIDGTTEAEDANALADNIDVSSAGKALLSGSTSGSNQAIDGTFRISSATDVVIFATVAGGTIPDTTKLHGCIVYQHE